MKCKEIYEYNMCYHRGALVVLCSPKHGFIWVQLRGDGCQPVGTVACDLADVITSGVTVWTASYSVDG